MDLFDCDEMEGGFAVTAQARIFCDDARSVLITQCRQRSKQTITTIPQLALPRQAVIIAVIGKCAIQQRILLRRLNCRCKIFRHFHHPPITSM
ncbi:hypothetical protein BMD20_29680 [Burkholderia multivorans]|nr:hypothetical protein BMD20_29680 [Burkholderia multivorans]KHS10365.1 hypothetical protein BMD22_28145 [Burkholderia multivorans]